MKKLAAALLLFIGLASPLLAQGVDIVTAPPIVFPGADGARGFVSMEATQIFWDDFGTGTLDTTNRWATPTTGGGGNAVAASNAVGFTTLSSGTTANGYSLLISQPQFAGRNPGYITGQWQVNVPFPSITGAYGFWGFLTAPGTPTAAAPLTNAVGFAIDTTGKLRAQTWASGAINVNIDLSLTQSAPQLCNCSTTITDVSVHKYQITFRGDNILWWVDGKLVAKVLTGAGGPDVNTLATGVLSVVGTGSIASALTIQLNQITLGDTSRNNTRVCDATFGWRCVTVGANGSLGSGSGGFPVTATPVTNSATGTTGAVAATLPAVAAKTTFICGFTVSSSGATTPTAVNVTLAGTISGTMNFTYSVVGVATDNQVPLTVPFTPCIPGSAVNTALVLTQPGVGAGATAASTTAWGYNQ